MLLLLFFFFSSSFLFFFFFSRVLRALSLKGFSGVVGWIIASRLTFVVLFHLLSGRRCVVRSATAPARAIGPGRSVQCCVLPRLSILYVCASRESKSQRAIDEPRLFPNIIDYFYIYFHLSTFIPPRAALNNEYTIRGGARALNDRSSACRLYISQHFFSDGGTTEERRKKERKKERKKSGRVFWRIFQINLTGGEYKSTADQKGTKHNMRNLMFNSVNTLYYKRNTEKERERAREEREMYKKKKGKRRRKND